MHISLLDVILDGGKSIHTTVAFEPEYIRFAPGVSFMELDKIEQGGNSPHIQTYPIKEKTPVELSVENLGNKVLEIKAQGSLTVRIPCDRCLKETDCLIPIDFSHKVDMKVTSWERIKELDESAYLTDTDLDVDTLVYLEVLMNWPCKVLCKPDCAGLCPVCGKDLNLGPCGCGKEPSDLRMAVIGDLFSDL